METVSTDRQTDTYTHNCTESNYDMMFTHLASLSDCLLGLLYALRFRAVSSVVDCRENASTSALNCKNITMLLKMDEFFIYYRIEV